MTAGRRILLFTIQLFCISQIIFSQVNMYVTDVNNKYTYHIETKRAEFTLMRHEVKILRFNAQFQNQSKHIIYQTRFITKGYLSSRSTMPSYVEGGQEKSGILMPEKDTTYTGELWIRPIDSNTATKDSFLVEAHLRYGQSPYDMMDIDRFTVVLNIIDPVFNPPLIQIEPPFSQGTTNAIFWIPAKGVQSQDVYCFDKENPNQLIKAVQGFYRISGQDTFRTVFQNLKSGHTYGYFVKAVKEIYGQKITLYSDFVYSTQDAVPPAQVKLTQAVVKNYGVVWLTWQNVSDNLSGIAYYRIYKTINTETDQLVDSVDVESGQKESLSWQDQVDSVSVYHYRVTAVDAAGNEGDGVISNEIMIKHISSAPIPPDFRPGDPVVPPVSERSFFRGTVDTLRFEPTGRETSIRFQAVRDSINYFEFPPADGMRFFDSGWLTLDSIPPDPKNSRIGIWPFDYTHKGQIDSNFVNGHRYFRRVITKFLSVADTLYLGESTPDCFPPDDIHNLKAQAFIEDPDTRTGYTKWYIDLEWKPASDAASGLKTYHIFRKVEKRDSFFQEIMLNKFLTESHFIDTLQVTQGMSITNPFVSYRIVAEDRIGHIRAFNKTFWEVREQALGSLSWTFDELSGGTYLSGQDTIYTKNDSILIKILRFDLASVYRFAIEINGEENLFENPGQNRLMIPLPNDEISKIRIRALYHGGRSSIWSAYKWAIRALNKPVQNISAWNDTSYWGGHVYIKWVKPSMDVQYYEIWRYTPKQDSILVGISASKRDTVVWTDYYDTSELTGKKSNPLTVYEMLRYRVRKINLFGQSNGFSNFVSSFSNKPPQILTGEVKTENNLFVILIRWRRPKPNLFYNNFTTHLRVYQDGLKQPFHADIVTDDDSTYAFRNAMTDHNYIFQTQEVLNDDPLKRKSSWSQPFTKSLRKIEMDVQPQPKGHIFIAWDNSAATDLYIHQYQLQRVSEKDTVNWFYPKSIISRMDSSRYLSHKKQYQYTLFVLDSLHQVIAANMKTDFCDTGSVFIPSIKFLPMRYFNSKTIDVSWQWRDIDRNPILYTTRGAKTCILQASVSKTFPSDTNQTVTIGPFPADPVNRTVSVLIPKLGNRENDRIYFHITAKDKWDHPTESIWSDDFYGLVEAVYDSIRPKTVSDFSVATIEAYYKKADHVVAGLRWTSIGVENPRPGSNEAWDHLISNIHRFRILRFQNNIETWIKDEIAHPKNSLYTAVDTLQNTTAKWKIVAVDSAGNSAESDWILIPAIVSTPAPPKPSAKRECAIQPLSASGSIQFEYFVEMAMQPNHFKLAYEIDPATVSDRLIYRTGWASGTQFICTSGWGSIETDTTYFRVKARNGTWESGWSEIALYASPSPNPGQNQQENNEMVPVTFAVFQNYPNPFNLETRISFQLPENGMVEIQIFSITGTLIRELMHEEKACGHHQALWDGKLDTGYLAPSGIYIAMISIRTENGFIFQRRIKMMMVK